MTPPISPTAHECTNCGVSVHRRSWFAHENYCDVCEAEAVTLIKSHPKLKHLIGVGGRAKQPLPPWPEIQGMIKPKKFKPKDDEE